MLIPEYYADRADCRLEHIVELVTTYLLYITSSKLLLPCYLLDLAIHVIFYHIVTCIYFKNL